jgi:ABC-type Fe3+-siderophore transport system permease subunit
VAFVLDMSYGQFPLSPGDVVATLLGGGPPGGEFTVIELRLPRALVAGFAGAALALSGTVFQTMVRNPLASPDIIGITGGASLAGVILFLSAASSAFVPVAAFGGALGTALILYLLAWRGGLSPQRLVLVGIGINALAIAGTSYMLVRGRVEEVQEVTVWLIGSVNNRLWSDVWPLTIGLAASIPLLAALGRSLDALALGEDVARALGVRVERAQLGLVALGALLVALAVAAAGPIGFVALIAPNIARRLAGNSGAAALPVAGLCGAAIVLIADFVARLALESGVLPVGVVTAIVGAPFFLFLLLRTNRIRTGA